MTTLQFTLLLTGWMILFIFNAHKHFKTYHSTEVRNLEDTINKIFDFEGEWWGVTTVNIILTLLWFVFVPLVLFRAFVIQFIIKDWKP